MIPMQFCRKLEAYYGKDMNPELTEEMLRYLRRFPQESLEKIYRRTLQMCRYFPKIAHIREASEDFLIRPSGKTKTRQGCPQCQYTTWVVVTLHHPLKKGETYEAVKTCKCTPRKIKPAASAVPEDEEEVPF